MPRAQAARANHPHKPLDPQPHTPSPQSKFGFPDDPVDIQVLGLYAQDFMGVSKEFWGEDSIGTVLLQAQ